MSLDFVRHPHFQAEFRILVFIRQRPILQQSIFPHCTRVGLGNFQIQKIIVYEKVQVSFKPSNYSHASARSGITTGSGPVCE
jgi:hypothetical protein